MLADVRLVFLAEELDGGQHGVRCRATQSAQGSVLHHVPDLLEQRDVALFAAALADLVEDIAHLA